MSWRARFAEPVPGAKPLRTLSDARAYVLALPSDQQDLKRWQTAAETLLHAAEHGGAWMDFARTPRVSTEAAEALTCATSTR